MVEKQSKKDNYLRFVHEQNSKYNLEILSEDDSDDFELIKKSFINTIGNNYNFKIERICRVHQKQTSRKQENIESDKILLFHGTPGQNVSGILREGFKSSKDGAFGAGVYHSNFFSKCLNFTGKPRSNKDCSLYFFVNEIPTKYLTEKHEFDHKTVLPEYYCHKYLSNPHVKEQYAPDSTGSLINIVKDEKIDAVDHFDIFINYGIIPEYVASSNIVVPKYLCTSKMLS